MSVQDMDTVSLDRVTGDGVVIEPVEAYAVVQFVWERLRQSRDANGRMMALPALGALVISATGDIDAMRRSSEVSVTMRRPHEIAQELGHLLHQLVASGRPELVGVHVACRDVIRRASLRVPVPGGSRPLLTPEAFFTALEMFRPRDAYAARAALFERWRTSRSVRPARAEIRPDHRVDVPPAAREEAGSTRQASATHRIGGRTRRAARELRLQFDSTPLLSQPQSDGNVRDGVNGPEPTISRGRLSLLM